MQSNFFPFFPTSKVTFHIPKGSFYAKGVVHLRHHIAAWLALHLTLDPTLFYFMELLCNVMLGHQTLVFGHLT